MPASKSASRLALVVDDSMLIRHCVCRFLEERGYGIETATNGLEALDILKRVRPDIIITDMQMPKMDGAALITAIKADSSTSKIPVVVVAGKQGGFDKREERAAYAIYKDINIEVQLAKALAVVFEEASAHACGK